MIRKLSASRRADAHPLWRFFSYAQAQIYWDDCDEAPHEESDGNRALQLFPLLAHVIPELEPGPALG
jgi:hypothetical protein